MREILFRGKRVDNGEWVYGLPYSSCYDGEIDQILVNDYHEDINPETVGQYTGLKDKNGVKIFEGDNVIYDDTMGAVFYDSDICMFLVKFEYTRSTYSFDSLEREIQVVENINVK